jgi:hypothetical protein
VADTGVRGPPGRVIRLVTVYAAAGRNRTICPALAPTPAATCASSQCWCAFTRIRPGMARGAGWARSAPPRGRMGPRTRRMTHRTIPPLVARASGLAGVDSCLAVATRQEDIHSLQWGSSSGAPRGLVIERDGPPAGSEGKRPDRARSAAGSGLPYAGKPPHDRLAAPTGRTAPHAPD